MASELVPIKTPEAVAELASRQRKLGQRHRTLLLLVDGKRNSDQVRQMAAQAGVADTAFDELIAMGMISMPEPPAEPEVAPAPTDEASDVPEAQAVNERRPWARAAVDSQPGPDSVVSSLLPPSLTLQPESVMDDSELSDPPSSDHGDLDSLIRDTRDDSSFQEARDIMVRAVRSEAPVAGSLTLLRLRRARTRADLEDLLGEVELRITKPFKGLWASQTMSRVRELLATQTVS